jgi:preprotein translocase subunit SecD
MYGISKWKLALIIGVFVFSALYLLPTISGVYGRLYGYFDIWMQGKIPPPEVQSGKEGEFIRFVIPKDDLPKGVSVQEASKSMQDIVGRRLTSLGIGEKEADEAGSADIPPASGEEEKVKGTEKEKEKQPEEGTEREEKERDSGFSFYSAETTDLYVKFTQMKSKAELEEIIRKFSADGGPPLVYRPPELPGGEHQGSIRLTITRDDFPEEGGMQEALKNIKDKLREKLEALEMKIGNDFSFSNVPGYELHVGFGSQKSRAELEKIVDDLHLYGSLPLAFRPIFPDNPLKQGLDLKGGLHIVLELDVKKAMEVYLDSQAKEVVLNGLKSEKIFCRSVEKTLEKRGDNMLILRPYVPESSAIGEVQRIADMKRTLIQTLGFNEEDIDDKETSGEDPKLTINSTNAERDMEKIADNLLGGNNPLIATITIPKRLLGGDREDYLKTADETLGNLELFDKPHRLRVSDTMAVFSVQLSEESAKRLAEDNIDTVMETLENRINKFGLAESTIRRVSGRPRILIEIPEEQNPARTLAAIKSPGILEFKLVAENPATGNPWYGSSGTAEPSPDELPPGTEVRQHVDGGWYVLHSEAFLHGADLKSNSATVRRGEFGTPEVIMFLTREGQRKFSDFTGQHVNELTAISLDEVIQSVPRITEKISSRSARITGNFTEEEADYLAKILKAGAFPAPMKSAEERIVGPTLGREAINRGKLAFSIGVTLVVVFMLVYYKWSGAIAVVALLFNFQIILGVLAGFGATLTLPGMAGLILTVGMSVDANVLILERIREELRSGKTVRSSIDSGYQKAFWTILDANVTTGFAALVLYEFGTGPIKGFAVTLSIGIVASMFTALVVTREIYRWAYRKRTITELSI